MFCHKCGNQSIEGSAFCQKCGAKLISDDSSQQTSAPMPSNSIQPQTLSPQTDKPKKKKSKKLPIILGAVALVIVAIIIAVSLGDKTDYVMTVKAHSPFVSQGYSYTYGTVLNDYIDSPIWEVSKANDKTYVNVRGKAKDTGDSVLISILVSVGVNDQATITPASVAMGSDRIEGQDNVVRFLLDLFMAYDGGQSGTSPKSGDTSYSTYTSEEHGFSFKYPSDWIDGGAQTVTEIIRVYDGYGASLSVAEVYVLPFELATGDEALIEAAINDNGIVPYKFVSIDDVGVNGKVMRELIYTSEDAVHGLLYVSNYFYFVEDRNYQIKIELPADTVDNYQTVYETMLNSYTVGSGGASAANSNQSEVAFKGISISYLLKTVDDVKGLLGNSSNDEFKLYYDDIEFYHSNGTIESIESFNPELFEVDGVTLDKSRAELISSLGNPSSEGEDGSGYALTFERTGYKLTIATGDKDGTAWRIFITPSGTSGGSPNEVLYKGETILNWLGARPENLYDVFGAPVRGTPVNGDMYNGGEYYGYDGVAFVIDGQTGGIGWILCAPEFVELGGATLDKTRTELVSILGEPSYEAISEHSGDYVMEYIHWGEPFPVVINLDLPNSDEKAYNITISPYSDGISDEEYQDIINDSAATSSDPVTADGKVLSVGSVVYAKQSVNYIRGYVTSIDSANSVNVAWDTVLENNLWGFTECAIFSDSYSISGYSYSASSTGTTVQLVGLKFNLSANELYSKRP